MGKDTFNFHNVGQGLFFECTISGMKIVYDCGTVSDKRILNAAIKRYNDSNRSDIDLLVISHFHKDHVRGIPELLKRRKVKTVVLPYISPAERLFAYTNSYMRVSDNDLRDFMLNPYNYLSAKEVGKVFIVTNGEPKPSTGDTNYSEEVVVRLDDDHNGREYIQVNFSEKLPEKHRIVKYNGNAGVGNWVFTFYNQQVDQTKIRQINNELMTLLNSDSLENFVQSEANLVKFKRLYLIVFNKNNLNATTLMMSIMGTLRDADRVDEYSISLGKRITSIFQYGICCPCRYPVLGQYKFGVLLTGDIDLNQNFDAIQSRYNDFQDVNIGLIPHHGSRHNWNDGFIMKPSSGYPTCIISTGYRYSNSMLDDLTQIVGNLLFVDQVRSVSITLDH